MQLSSILSQSSPKLNALLKQGETERRTNSKEAQLEVALNALYDYYDGKVAEYAAEYEQNVIDINRKDIELAKILVGNGRRKKENGLRGERKEKAISLKREIEELRQRQMTLKWELRSAVRAYVSICEHISTDADRVNCIARFCIRGKIYAYKVPEVFFHKSFYSPLKQFNWAKKNGKLLKEK